METVSNKLRDIQSTLTAELPETVDFAHLRELRSRVHTIDSTLVVLQQVYEKLQSSRLQYNGIINKQIVQYRSELDTIGSQFGVVKSPRAAKPTHTPRVEHLNVDIGSGVVVRCKYYECRESIPVLQYGALVVDKRPLVVFRVSQNGYVSCTHCTIIDHYSSQENYRTICCLNGQRCQYGNSCKYYHDPLMWPESTHIQKFPRNYMIKNCANFGDAQHFRNQIRGMGFENLQTFTRYLAVMMLLVRYSIEHNG